MKIALVQQRATEDREANRRRGLEAVDEAAEQGAQVVCFAELGFDPFYPQQPAGNDTLGLAEPVPGPTTEMFAERAAARRVVLVLNLFERDGDGFRHAYAGDSWRDDSVLADRTVIERGEISATLLSLAALSVPAGDSPPF